MDAATALREFLEYIIGQLIDQPEAGAIAHELSEDGKQHHFRVTLSEDDVGMIIGKGGHTVTAMRNLLNAAAARDGQRVTLKVTGPMDYQHPEDEEGDDA